MLKGKRQAVIIGIDEYEDRHNIKPLPGAENDAIEIYEKLKDPNIGNFEISEDHFLVSKNARRSFSLYETEL
jgi:hypothetical protein